MIDSAINRDLTIRFGRRAVPRNMPCLTTLVAYLACRVQGAAVGSCTVARDMAQLAACIAFHGLRLAVTSIVIRSTTLVACCRAWTTSPSCETPTKSTGESSTRRNSPAPSTECRSGWKAYIWARSRQMTRLAARIATSTSSAGTADT